MSGSGGATPVAQTTSECLQYIADYAAELVLAKDCNDGGGPGSNNGNGNGNAQEAPMCGTLVPAALAGCGSNCSTYVNKPSRLDQLQQMWVKARCVDPICAKPTACVSPAGSTCAPGTGRCSDL